MVSTLTANDYSVLSNSLLKYSGFLTDGSNSQILLYNTDPILIVDMLHSLLTDNTKCCIVRSLPFTVAMRRKSFEHCPRKFSLDGGQNLAL